MSHQDFFGLNGNPTDIYDSLNEKIKEIISKFNFTHEQAGVNEKHEWAKSILCQQQEKIEEQINSLKSNTEWRYFTMAFFGETNAGKSTIIETLRILLNEEVKQKQQNEFQKIYSKFLLEEDRLTTEELLLVENKYELKKIEEIKEEINKKFDREELLLKDLEVSLNSKSDEKFRLLENKYEPLIAGTNQELNILKQIIFDKKSVMAWWLKIVFIFIRLAEEKKLSKLIDYLQMLPLQKKQQLSLLEQEKKQIKVDINNKKDELDLKKIKEVEGLKDQEKKINLKIQELLLSKENLLAQIKQLTTDLEPFRDGVIVGDGRSDFTRESKAFDFMINNYPVKIIDVPGIEGKEPLVFDEISKAVQKSHAVFYVTSKDAPPNEGTLEKIKIHLNSQTEVWSIFNKPVTNPRQLKGDLLKNDDERKALSDLNATMSKALGKAYKRDIVISGLPAFFSVATCLVPSSTQFEQQKKFLTNMSREELLKFSRLESFSQTLQKDIVGNVSVKIKTSNFNKANVLVKDTVKKLISVEKEFELLKKDIQQQLTITKHEVEGLLLDFEQNIKVISAKSINSFKSSVRERTYKKITDDISNSDFKSFFKDYIDDGLKELEISLNKSFKESITNFEYNLFEITEKLSKRLNNLFGQYNESVMKSEGIKFDLDFNIKDGINKAGLAGVAIGLAAFFWWNPVGWVAIAFTATGLVISFTKAVWGYFDSNFKKSEQRRNVDKNLSEICKKLDVESRKNIVKVVEEVSVSMILINKKLEQPLDSVVTLNEDLNSSIHQFNNLSKVISQQYGE
jgi:hypothetical protein